MMEWLGSSGVRMPMQAYEDDMALEGRTAWREGVPHGECPYAYEIGAFHRRAAWIEGWEAERDRAYEQAKKEARA